MQDAQDISTAYSFYRDATTEGCVIAVDLAASDFWSDYDGWEGLAATYDRPNSPVSSTRGHEDALGERLTVSDAREIHPRLFRRLECGTAIDL